MIPVFVGDETREARRIQQGLAAVGIAVQLTECSSGLVAPDSGIVLVHISRISHFKKQHTLASLIAFGGADTAEVAVRSLRQGAFDYLPEGTKIDQISAVIRERSIVPRPAGETPMATSAAMQRLLELAERVARVDISVLISGESGTGKEVVARQIHQLSTRANGSFVAVNCAAIPETMLEAVLFGHEKGAFTGASEKRKGKFELADKGTLLLDEITEMPVALQAKLLRVLQEKEVEPIGSNQPRQIDVRVLATSNRDLAEAIKAGQMREDLYYRLSVFPLVLPPLREREDDVLRLAEHFLAKYAERCVPELTAAARASLLRYQWPGNVRELENSMQRAIVLCSENRVLPADLGLDLSVTIEAIDTDTLHHQMRVTQDQLLLRTLAENQGVRKTTASQLGISERTLRYKLKQLRDRGVLT